MFRISKQLLTHSIALVFSSILGFLGTAFYTKFLTVLITGKSFDERSWIVKVFLVLLIWLMSSVVCFAVVMGFRRWVSVQSGYLRLLDILTKLDHSPKVTTFFFGIVGLVLTALLFVNLKIVSFPYQMEYREGAIVLTGEAFLRGINPWDVQNNPVYINVYGFFYNLVLMPIIWIFGNKVWIYRAGSLIAILGQIVLVTKILRQHKVSWILCGCAAAFLWLGQIFYTTPLARPDALGQFLFLGSILIPLSENFTNRSLVISGILAILGFYTKPYFLLGFPLLAVWLFLFSNKIKAVTYAILVAVALLLSALVVNTIYDAYFMNVIYSHIADTNRYFDFMVKQTIKFLLDYWFLIIISLESIYWVVQAELSTRIKRRFSFRLMNSPLLTGKEILGLNAFMLISGSLMVYFSFGRHNGTNQVYYYQLLAPFLLLVTIPMIQNLHKYQSVAFLLLSLNLLTHSIQNLWFDFKPNYINGWKRLDEMIIPAQKIMNSPVVVISMIDQGKPVINSGQSPYYFPLPQKPNLFYPQMDLLERTGKAYKEIIREGLEQKEFDLFLADSSYQYRNSQRFFQQIYPTEEIITLEMPHVGQEWTIWVKKPLETKVIP